MVARDKGAIVTGAASGMGQATARRAAQEGARVICIDATDPEPIAAEIRDGGGIAHAVRGDVRDGSTWEQATSLAADNFGGVFLLANIAGINPAPDTVVDLDEAGWDRILDINLKGIWMGMRAVIPGMVQRGEGRIVNIASLAATVGLPGQAAYTASKAGVAGLTRQAAVEYGSAGIRVNAIAPGVIDTPMIAGHPPEMTAAFLATTPVGRAGRPEEIADTIMFFAGPTGDFITGQLLGVDGGWSIRG